MRGMANRRSMIRQAEVTRFTRAVRRAGVEVDRVEIDVATGKVVLFAKGKDGCAPPPGNALDEWLAKHARTA
jgi:hypothetical protein